MSMSGGGNREGGRDARMDSTLPTNGTAGDPDDKEDDDADNATNGGPAPAGSSTNNVFQTVPNGTTRSNPILLNLLTRGRAPAQLDVTTAVRFPQNENAYVPFNSPQSAPRGSIHEVPVSPTSVRRPPGLAPPPTPRGSFHQAPVSPTTGQHPPGLTDRREPGPGYGAVPGTEYLRGGPVGQFLPEQYLPPSPDEYLQDLDQRQAATIQNGVASRRQWVEGFLGVNDTFDYNGSRASTPIDDMLARMDQRAVNDDIVDKLEAYDELETTMTQVTRFAGTLPPLLSRLVLAAFMEHYRSTDVRTAAVAAFLQLTPFLFWMSRSMAAFHLQDPAVMAYVPGTVMLPCSFPAPARAPVSREVLPRPSRTPARASLSRALAALERAFEVEELLGSAPSPDGDVWDGDESFESQSAVQEQVESMGEAEAVPTMTPAPEIAPESGVQQEQIEPVLAFGPAPEAAAQEQPEPTRETEAMPPSSLVLELAPGFSVPTQEEPRSEFEALYSSSAASEANSYTLDHDGMRDIEARLSSGPAREATTQDRPESTRGTGSMTPPELVLGLAPGSTDPDQDELRREYEAVPSFDSMSDTSSHTLDHEHPGDIEAMPLPGLASEATAQDQTRPTTRPEADPAALNTTQVEAGLAGDFARGLVVTNVAFDAAQTLAPMRSEEMLLKQQPTTSSDGQPPANLPNATGQSNSMPPPVADKDSSRPDLQPSNAHTTSLYPGLTPEQEREILRARGRQFEQLVARAGGVMTPDSESSTVISGVGSVEDDQPAEFDLIAERPTDVRNALFLHGQPRAVRDMASWSPRERQIFDNWVYAERISMSMKVSLEQLNQIRLEDFIQSFYYPLPGDEPQRPEERRRSNSLPPRVDQGTPARLDTIDAIYKLHAAWKQFVEEASQYLDNPEIRPSDVEAAKSRLARGAELEHQTGFLKQGRVAEFWNEAASQHIIPHGDPEWEALKTDAERFGKNEELEIQNEHLRRALAQGELPYYHGGDQHRANTKFSHEESDGWSCKCDDCKCDDAESPARKKRPKRSKGRTAVKTKKELKELVQQRNAARIQQEQQASQSTSPAPAYGMPSASPKVPPLEKPKQPGSVANQPETITSTISQAVGPEAATENTAAAAASSEEPQANPQAATPQASREPTAASNAKSEEAKAKAEEKERERAKLKAKKKAKKERKHAEKQEAEEKKIAIELARKAAEQAELEIARAKAEAEREAKEQEAKEREAREQEAKEREAREQAAREQAAMERETMEREIKEREAKWERKAREQKAREQEARETEFKEQKARGRRAKERAARERKAREREAKNREAREREAKEREAEEKKAATARAREEAERLEWENAKAKVQQEQKLAMEREAGEREAREREAREREAREREAREREAKEREAEERELATALARQQAAQQEEHRLKLEDLKAQAARANQHARDWEAQHGIAATAITQAEAEAFERDIARAKAEREAQEAKERKAQQQEEQGRQMALAIVRHNAGRQEGYRQARQVPRQDASQHDAARQETAHRVAARQRADRIEQEHRRARMRQENQEAVLQREAEEKMMAALIVRQEAERLELESYQASVMAQKQSQLALARQRRQQEATERRTEALAKQAAERLEVERKIAKAKAEKENKQKEGNGRRILQRQEAERMGPDPEHGQKLHSEKLLSLLKTNESPDPQASHSGVSGSVNSGQKYMENLRSEQATCLTCQPPAADKRKTPQGEQTAGPEIQPPAAAAAEHIDQTSDVPAPPRPSSEAPPPRIEQHATFLVPSDSSPRLPAQRSDTSGPSVSSLDNFAEVRRDLHAEVQYVAALQQQRIEFEADGSSSVPTSPARRGTTVEREEPSEVTHPEPRQPDVERGPVEPSEATSLEPRQSHAQSGSSPIEAPQEHHPSSAQQQHSDGAMPLPRAPRVVFQLGSETSEVETDTTAEQELALNAAIAQRESTRSDVQQQPPDDAVPTHRVPRVVFQLGSDTSEVNTDSTAGQQLALNEAGALRASAAPRPPTSSVQQQQPSNAVPLRPLQRAVFQLGSEASEADMDTTTEQQLALNTEVDLRETARRVALNLGEIDLRTDSFGASSMTSDPLQSPVPTQTQTALTRAVESMATSGPTSGPLSNSLVSSTVPDGSTQEPRPGNPQPNPHGHPPTPNDHPVQQDPRDQQQRPWNLNPAAGQFFPDASGFYSHPDSAPRLGPPPGLLGPDFYHPVYELLRRPEQPPPLTQPQDDLPAIVDGRTPEQRRRSPLPGSSAPAEPHDELPCIVNGRTPEQRRGSAVPDTHAPAPPQNQGQDSHPRPWVWSPQVNGTYQSPYGPGVPKEHHGSGISAQAVTMPSSMAPAVAPPLTTHRESRPTEHRLSLDPDLNVSGGDECAIASSSSSDAGGDANGAYDQCVIYASSGSEWNGDVDDADDESSGKDP
jgi:hypothetical protein